MMNLCLLIFVTFMVRKILWMINADLMALIEGKIKFAFYTAVSFVMFIVDISTPTKTERAIYSNTKRSAQSLLQTKRELLEGKKITKKTKQMLTLLEPVAVERTNDVKKGDHNKQNSSAA